MPRPEKNNERTERAPQGNRKQTKVEYLHPQVEITDRNYNNLAKFPSENPYPVLRIHQDGTILYANKASEPILKAKETAAGLPAPPEWQHLAKNALSSGQVLKDETTLNERVFEFLVVPITGSNDVNFYGMDITEQRIAHEEREITIKLLSLINSKNQIHDLMKLVTGLLRDWSGCEAVGIRLRDGEDFPYFETNGFSDEFVRAESKLCSLNELGEPIRDSRGRVYLECMCGNIISGRFDHSKPFFTEHGSFWTNSTTALLASTTNADRMVKTRNRCNTAGYESVAIVPLRTGRETFGLLQFNSKQKNQFNPKKISLLERLADNLAIGLAQRKTEESLRESEIKFRAMFENSRDAINVSKKGVQVFSNPAFLKLYGYGSNEEIASTSVIDHIAPSYRQQIIQNIHRRAAGESAPTFYETRGMKKDGTEFDEEINVSTYELNGETYSIAIIRDITERKQAEEKLQNERNLLRTLIDHMPDGVYIKDKEGRILGYNKSLAESWETRGRDDVIGKTDFDLFKPEVAQNYFDEERKIMQTGQPIINKEAACTDNSGNPNFLLVTKVPLLDSAGNITGLVGIHRDITERKKAEETILRLNKILTMIADISQHILLIQDKDLLLKKICEAIIDNAYRMAWIGFCDENSKKIIPQAQAGFEEGYLESIKVTFDDTEYGMGPSGMAVKTAKPNVMRFIATDPRFEPWRTEAVKRGYRSSTAIPIFSENKVVGVLNVYADTADAFGQEEVQLLEGLANDISTGLRSIDEQTRRCQAEQTLLEYQKHLKQLAAQLTLVSEQERRRIAGEIHDEMSQTLAMEAAVDAVAKCRDGRGPVFIECVTKRWAGSNPLWPELVTGVTDMRMATGEVAIEGEHADWYRYHDPVLLFARELAERGLDAVARIHRDDEEILREFDAAAAWALASPFPEASSALSHVFATASA